MMSKRMAVLICAGVCLVMPWYQGYGAAQDSPARWNLGAVPSQSVWHGSTYACLVQWEGHPEATLTARTSPPPAGPFAIQPMAGELAGWWQLTYRPAPGDKFPFLVTLTGMDGTESLSQALELSPMPNLVAEQTAFDPARHTQSGLIEIGDPAPQITKAGNTVAMNHQTVHPRSVMIRQPLIEIQPGHANGYYEMFDGARDIQVFEMVAEQVIIRGPLRLHQTHVIIRARELRMEGPAAAVITTPVKQTAIPGLSQPGGNGLPAGDVTLEIGALLVTHPGIRFDLRGGPGQDGGDGADGVNGTSMAEYWKTVSWRSGWIDLTWTAPNDEWIIYHELWNTCTFGIPIMILPDRPVGGISTFPTSGTNATASGKPGKGGAGGRLRSAWPGLAGYASTGPGVAGRTPPQRLGEGRTGYWGGAAGWPNKWLKIKANYCTEAGVWATDSYQNHGGPTTAGANAAVVPPDGPSAGDYGSVLSEGDPHGWIDPVLLDLLFHRARDQYLNGQLDDARVRMEDLCAVLEAAMTQWPSTPDDARRDLLKLYDQMQTLLYQIGNNLDYYGNPAGWAPMLSFEVNTTLFDQEIDRAIDMLYLAHWIGKTNATQTQKCTALKELNQQLRAELLQAQTDFNEAMTRLGALKTRAAEIRQAMEQRVLSLEALENQLEMQAAGTMQTPWWKTGLKVAAVMCKVVPVVQPVAGYIGKGMDMAVNFNADQPYETVLRGTQLVDTMVADKVDQVTDALGAAIGVATGSYGDAVKVAVDSLGISKTGVTDFVSGMKTAFEEVRASAGQVKAELERLKGLSPEFKVQAGAIEALQDQHAQFARDTAETMLKLVALSDLIRENLLAIDTLREELASKPAMDARAVMYVQNLKRRAVERLQKYHYYMAKAYEYRLLKPYTQPLNLDGLMNEFGNTAPEPEGDVIPAGQFATLKGIYKDAVAAVAGEIYTQYNNNRPELSAPVRFNLTADELTALNGGRPVRLNLVDMGLFPSDDENIRIVNFKVHEIQTAPAGGDYEENGYLDLTIEHSGLSKLMSGGQTYLFRHYNRQTTNPIVWGARYFPHDNEVNPIAPSAASGSLLKSLLPGAATADMMLYSRPSAWADLEFSVAVRNNAGKAIDLKKLRLELQYDFVPRNTQLRLCDIQVQVATVQPPVTVPVSQNGFMPYFIFGTADANLRSDARGWTHRLYPINSLGQIAIEAQVRYGNWKFNKWTNQYGQDLPGGPWLHPMIQVVPDRDKVFAAQYVPLTVLGGGDLNSDCVVDLTDFAAMATVWMTEYPGMSVNGTNPFVPIGPAELAALTARWGLTCEEAIDATVMQAGSPMAPASMSMPDDRQLEVVGD